MRKREGVWYENTFRTHVEHRCVYRAGLDEAASSDAALDKLRNSFLPPLNLLLSASSSMLRARFAASVLEIAGPIVNTSALATARPKSAVQALDLAIRPRRVWIHFPFLYAKALCLR